MAAVRARVPRDVFRVGHGCAPLPSLAPRVARAFAASQGAPSRDARRVRFRPPVASGPLTPPLVHARPLSRPLARPAVYGWPALRRDLIREGGLTERELGAVFTCGAWSVQGGRFLVGLARDALGTRVAACACLVLVVLGSALVALADAGDFPAMCFGMLFLGMGSGAQLCVQPVTMLFQRTQSTMMASLSGAFQLSGLVFLLCSLLAGAGAARGRLPRPRRRRRGAIIPFARVPPARQRLPRDDADDADEPSSPAAAAVLVDAGFFSGKKTKPTLPGTRTRRRRFARGGREGARAGAGGTRAGTRASLRATSAPPPRTNRRPRRVRRGRRRIRRRRSVVGRGRPRDSKN